MAYQTIYTLNPAYMIEGTGTVGSIWRTNNTTQEVTVYLSMTANSAVAGVDYIDNPQTLTFAPGQTQVFYTVQSLEDSQFENTESFTLTLTAPGSSTVLAQTVGTIADNDYLEEDFQATPYTSAAPVTPARAPVAPAPATPFAATPSGGTVIYTDNSVTNYNYVDNSTNVTNYSIVTTTTYNGSSRSDRLEGSASNDSLTGFGGNDSLNGLSGDDIISGGKGNDRIFGGPGANQLSGGAGRDRYYLTAEGQESKADIIRDLNVGDRIFIQGATRQGLTVNETRGGVGIFNNGVLEALYTGNALSLGQVSNMITAA